MDVGEALSSPLYDPDQGSFGYDRNVGGGMDIVGQAEGFHGLLLENKRKQLYLLKPLGGSTSFLESKFFREIYNKTDFKNTYLDEFLGDAYTIINPYTFLVADYLAKSAD